MSSTRPIEERKAQIREATLARADRRRRNRRLREGSFGAACLAGAVGLGWVMLRPAPVPRPPSGSGASAAAADSSERLPVRHDIAEASMSTVVERAISDNELLDLLREAGEEAGLGIIDGQARLVPWHRPQQSAPSEGPEPTGAAPGRDFISVAS